MFVLKLHLPFLVLASAERGGEIEQGEKERRWGLKSGRGHFWRGEILTWRKAGGEEEEDAEESKESCIGISCLLLWRYPYLHGSSGCGESPMAVGLKGEEERLLPPDTSGDICWFS